jgi:SAM-dependent methyltransferase
MMESLHQNRLDEHYARREIWARKPQIRLVYERWVKKIRKFLVEGTLLEVGSGSGPLKDFLPEILLSDVVKLPWIDEVIDCMDMPFEENSLGGIISLDLLHHVLQPHAFLKEAARVLRPGGRVFLVEPYITPGSYVGYKLLHHEDINFKEYHAGVKKAGEKADPWQGNSALANLVFKRDLKHWDVLQPDLDIIHREIFSLFDFQGAAGFKPHAYVPHWLFKHLVKVDDLISFLMPVLGYRIFVVLEKKTAIPA